MILIDRNTCVKAWLEAVRHLRSQEHRRDYNVILSVKTPMMLPKEDKVVHDELDALLRRSNTSINTVINTIFPVSFYLHHGKDGMFKKYEETLPRLQEETCNSRGTYAARMQNRTSGTKTINPLKNLVQKLGKQAKTSGPKRAAYELGIVDPFLDIPVYDAELDSGPIMGFPCLSHLSFKLKDDKKLMLTAFYRSHYYMERALGNLFGLAWLQHFVARETGLETAELVCISSMAQLETKTEKKESDIAGWDVSDIDLLLKKYQKILPAEDGVHTSV